MATILIAWELGEGYGHVVPCLRLANGLRERGHRAVLALKDVRLPPGWTLPEGVALLQAPLTPHAARLANPPINYADLLLACGFGLPEELAARLAAWLDVIHLVRADMVVGDHAPTALLSASLAGIPHQSFGNGFAVPPATTPWPSIRPWDAVPDAALIHAEATLHRCTETALKILGYDRRVDLRGVLCAPGLLNTFPELDHYGERDGGAYVGPFQGLDHARFVRWSDHGKGKVYAYLRPHMPGLRHILEALAGCGAEVVCHIPGLAPELDPGDGAPSLRIVSAAVDLDALLPEADLVLGYGSSGLATTALLHGVPLLARPRFVEQAMLARRIEMLGLGRMSDARKDARGMGDTLQQMLATAEYRANARRFQRRHQGFSPVLALERTLDAIEDKWGGR